jgi:hypothetical protein
MAMTFESPSRFTVESGIPIPGQRSGRRRLYPFPEMKVGDSFAVPTGSQQTVRSAACWYGVRNRKQFSVRKSATGFRCWRIA